jgi:Dolichyl-phosphate-mannose-protein mannosyltransferase
MTIAAKLVGSIKSLDRVLALSLLLGFFLSLHGITWGRVKCMNPDRIAFIDLFRDDRAPFNPGWFLKPPFHAYFNYVLSVKPVEQLTDLIGRLPKWGAMGKWARAVGDSEREIRLVWSRVLTIFLFLGSVTLVFVMMRNFFGLNAARFSAVMMATSAGFIAFNHFLTADVAVVFWMLFALYFAHRIVLVGRWRDYVLAGLLTGLSAATKYNGLAIGMAIVTAHWLSQVHVPLRERLINPRLAVGLLMVPVGFICANPYSVLDHSTFVRDFIYYYTVTPQYTYSAGHSYWKFFSPFSEIIGLPVMVVSTALVVGSVALLISRRNLDLQARGMLLLLSIFLLYYVKFGSFPLLKPRYLLPVVPIWLMLTGPVLDKLRRYSSIVWITVIILTGYNVLCCFHVGKRFADDPRMAAMDWAKDHVPSGSTIEASVYSPSFGSVKNVKTKVREMPHITGRVERFKKIFEGNRWVTDNIKREGIGHDHEWFTAETLTQRRPDFISINSLAETDANKEFFAALWNEKLPYRIVFDGESKMSPAWVYPRHIDFLHNRMTVLKREAAR